MNARRRKKALKKLMEGRPLTSAEQRLRERLDRLESGHRALIADLGGHEHGANKNRNTEDMRHLPVGQADR